MPSKYCVLQTFGIKLPAGIFIPTLGETRSARVISILYNAIQEWELVLVAFWELQWSIFS